MPARSTIRPGKHLLTAALLLTSTQLAKADELISARSPAPVAETLDRLQTSAIAAGFVIVARIDHAKNAAAVGQSLRPTEVLLFGNPKGGTPVMQCDQRAGLDLPLRALAWQDEAGQVWLGMTDPQVLKARFSLSSVCDAAVAAMEGTVRRLVGAAVSP